MSLIDLVRNYQELLDKKEYLAEAVKANGAAIEAAKEELIQQMLDDDCPRISWGDYSFGLSAKTAYSKRSQEELEAVGLDFFSALREEGLGDLITETVNPRTLQAALKSYVEENGELSEGLALVVKSYDYNDITRRKEQRRRK